MPRRHYRPERVPRAPPSPRPESFDSHREHIVSLFPPWGSKTDVSAPFLRLTLSDLHINPHMLIRFTNTLAFAGRPNTQHSGSSHASCTNEVRSRSDAPASSWQWPTASSCRPAISSGVADRDFIFRPKKSRNFTLIII